MKGLSGKKLKGLKKCATLIGYKTVENEEGKKEKKPFFFSVFDSVKQSPQVRLNGDSMEILVLFMFLSTGEVKTQEFNSKSACICVERSCTVYTKCNLCQKGAV